LWVLLTPGGNIARPDVPAARPGTDDVVEPRDGLDVEVVEAGCYVIVGAAMLPHLQNPKIEIRPFSLQAERARASLIDRCRHWRRSAMVRRASAAARDEGGGCQAVSRHFHFGVKWPSAELLLVLRSKWSVVVEEEIDLPCWVGHKSSKIAQT